ncbi:DinB family protein [Myroides guanonis]|uniref:Uncharacterized damage-inducible protein DinB (Forms a four-helix bundle) n=1 Tax=Myroides guanonis TaxID=1150112 RepID=A0A1I3Q8X7_9FLAO|nr:DinB family protein [Myroides guanonis]SFJ30573.1 Uncharacterized damage-inducible protein DinB (forms a four-helix bundle) [Myroides guanonis]
MSIKQSLLIELERESDNTLRMLERLEGADFSWKPHPKSMSLGALANHIVELHDWMSLVITQSVLDFQKDYAPMKLEDVSSLSTVLKSSVAETKDIIENLDEALLFEDWTLQSGDYVIMTAPKIAAIRFVVNNHLIHHRGQLSVYMRLLDIPVPGIYGPSADEQQ